MDIYPVITYIYFCNVEYRRSPHFVIFGSKEYSIPPHNQRVDTFGAIGAHICEFYEKATCRTFYVLPNNRLKECPSKQLIPPYNQRASTFGAIGAHICELQEKSPLQDFIPRTLEGKVGANEQSSSSNPDQMSFQTMNSNSVIPNI